MSRAFVKEEGEQLWLHEVAGTISALQVYLTRENGGSRVTEVKAFFDPAAKKEVHVMSNGLSYTKDEEGKWYVL